MVSVAKALAPRRGKIRKTDPKKAVAYIRVSTGRQELGPKAQKASLEAYALAHGVEIVSWHSETVSGSAPLNARPGLFDAISDAKRLRAGIFLVAKRGRFARDAFVTELLSRDMAGAGIVLHCADQEEANGNSPEAMLLRRMLDAVAEYERALIAARTRAALAALKRKGLRGPGSLPFGKRLAADGETLLDDRSEAAIVRRIIRERDDGSPLRAIVEGLNADGVPARGGRWHRTTVSRVLSRKE